MNKVLRISLAIILILLSYQLFAQQDEYKSKGLSSIQRGDYDEALKQFDAAIAVMKLKKVDALSSQFIEVEKLQAYAKECRGHQREVKKYEQHLSGSAMQSAFERCNDAQAALRVRDSLCVFVDAGRKGLSRICARFPSDNTVAEYRKKFNEAETVIKGYVDNFTETLEWKAAHQMNTEESYSSYLSKYPKGHYVSNAKAGIVELRDDKFWRSISANSPLDSYRKYISEFPDGKHSDEARKVISEKEELIAWSCLNKSSSSSEISGFMKSFPNGKFSKEASSLLSKAKESECFAAKASTNTVKGYSEYLKRYPKGVYVEEARNRIDKIKEKEAWDKVLAVNTIEGYRLYLKQSSRKAYAKEANAKIEELQDLKNDEFWGQAVSRNSIDGYQEFLDKAPGKRHKDEAKANKYLLVAQAKIENNSSMAFSSFKAIFYLGSNPRTLIIDKNRSLYENVLDRYDYNNFCSNNTIASANLYLKDHPKGLFENRVKSKLLRLLCDDWEYLPASPTERQIANIKQYANEEKDFVYLDSKIKENKRLLKKIESKGYAKYKGTSVNGGKLESRKRSVRVGVESGKGRSVFCIDGKLTYNVSQSLDLNYGYHTVTVQTDGKSKSYVFLVTATSPSLYVLPSSKRKAGAAAGTVLGTIAIIGGAAAGVAAAALAK